MKYLIVFALTLSALAQTALVLDIEKVTRSVSMPGHFYVVEYGVINRGAAFVPATVPAGVPHYDAVISVKEIIRGEAKLIGKPFRGQYTETGCFEDNPTALVAQALRATKPEVEQAPAK